MLVNSSHSCSLAVSCSIHQSYLVSSSIYWSIAVYAGQQQSMLVNSSLCWSIAVKAGRLQSLVVSIVLFGLQQSMLVNSSLCCAIAITIIISSIYNLLWSLAVYPSVLQYLLVYSSQQRSLLVLAVSSSIHQIYLVSSSNTSHQQSLPVSSSLCRYRYLAVSAGRLQSLVASHLYGGPLSRPQQLAERWFADQIPITNHCRSDTDHCRLGLKHGPVIKNWGPLSLFSRNFRDPLVVLGIAFLLMHAHAHSRMYLYTRTWN